MNEKIDKDDELDIDSDEIENDAITKNGYVYLLKGKEGYKVGMTTSPYERFSTIIKSLPHGGEPIHHFATDDPRGIEKYWQEIRWKDKRISRKNANDGEWFNLNASDVADFKRRKKYM